jgi:putative peptidoglycan lipid II flippase
MLELAFLQVARTIELFLSSLINSAAYTYFTLANSLQALPVGLFGTSLAKAALPTLTEQSDDLKKFKHTLLSTLYLVFFLIVPVSVVLSVLRIPIVRILFGTNLFDWKATVQTGLVLSAFSLGIPFQAAVMLLSRAYYALHNTKTPVTVSFLGTTISILTSILLVRLLHLPTWGLSLSYSFGIFLQAIILFFLLSKKLNGGMLFSIKPILKTALASTVSGSSMFFILKFFDRSVWVKKLSFITNLANTKDLNFHSFVLDTRYTPNLIILMIFTSSVGFLSYLLVSFLLNSQELQTILRVIKTRKFKSLPSKEESLTPPAPDSTQI